MSSQRIPGRWLVPLSVGLLTVQLGTACSVKQDPNGEAAECYGDCDAGAKQSDDDPPISVKPFDAAVPEVPLADAAPPPTCPVGCLPDDELACPDGPGVLEVSASGQLSVAPGELDGAGGATSVLARALELGVDSGVSVELGVESADAGRGAVDSPGASTDDSEDEPDVSLVDAGVEPPDASAAPIDVIEAGEALGPGPDPADVEYSCQLRPGERALEATCAPAGSGVVGDACSSGSDCAAGFACVAGRLGTGQCQPYCCAGRGSCDPGLICTERRLMVPSSPAGSSFLVPVCTFPDQCDLMEPFPCPSGQSCSCSPGLACSVVGRDGAKACIEPGTGREGDACPCAAGHFCSPAQRQCLKLCQFGSSTCGDGACQGVGGFPDGWGLCVGVDDPMLQGGR